MSILESNRKRAFAVACTLVCVLACICLPAGAAQKEIPAFCMPILLDWGATNEKELQNALLTYWEENQPNDWASLHKTIKKMVAIRFGGTTKKRYKRSFRSIRSILLPCIVISTTRKRTKRFSWSAIKRSAPCGPPQHGRGNCWSGEAPSRFGPWKGFAERCIANALACPSHPSRRKICSRTPVNGIGRSCARTKATSWKSWTPRVCYMIFQG